MVHLSTLALPPQEETGAHITARLEPALAQGLSEGAGAGDHHPVAPESMNPDSRWLLVGMNKYRLSPTALSNSGAERYWDTLLMWRLMLRCRASATLVGKGKQGVRDKYGVPRFSPQLPPCDRPVIQRQCSANKSA